MTADVQELRSYAVLAALPMVRGHKGEVIITSNSSVLGTSAVVPTKQERAVSGHYGYVMLAEPASVLATHGYASARRPDANVIGHFGYVVTYSQYPPYPDLNLKYEFLDVRFPTCISYGSSGGPGFKTSVFEVDNGMVHAQAEWDRLRARYDVRFDHANADDLDNLEHFFYAMRGKAIGFRFKDWNDYTITHQNVGVGDGENDEFQLFKRYRSGSHFFDRIITKPVYDTLGRLYVDDVELVENRDFYINHTSGIIKFEQPPGPGSIIRIDYIEYDVPVRFDTDELTVEAVDFDQYVISSLQLIEILI